MAEPWLIRFFACNREMQPFSFFFCYSLWGVISGRVRALNLTVPLGSGRVGSDDLGYGPGSGFSFEPVQTSSPQRSQHTGWGQPKKEDQDSWRATAESRHESLIITPVFKPCQFKNSIEFKTFKHKT